MSPKGKLKTYLSKDIQIHKFISDCKIICTTSVLIQYNITLTVTSQ